MDALENLCHKCRWLLCQPLDGISESARAFLRAASNEIQTNIHGLNCDGQMVVAFCGRTNVGKSTLMNALLGGKIAPVSNGDWSARPVEYRFAADEMIFLADYYPPRRIRFGSSEELNGALQELSTVARPENSFGKNHLVVTLNTPGLADGLVFCDMPGFLATSGNEEDADAGGEGTHDKDVRQYLGRWQDRLRVELVSNAQLPDESVIRFVRENFPPTPLTVIVNYRTSDRIEERKERLESVWRESLTRPLDFFYINAKKALTGSEEKDALIAHLKQYGTPEGRRLIAYRSLVRVLRDTGMYLLDFEHYSSVEKIFPRQRLSVAAHLAEEPEFAELRTVFKQYWR